MQRTLWHVTGFVLIKNENKSVDFSCVASDIYEAINKARDYGIKNISGVYKSSTTLKEN